MDWTEARVSGRDDRGHLFAVGGAIVTALATARLGHHETDTTC